MKFEESLDCVNLESLQMITEFTYVAEAACPSTGVWFPSDALPV